MQLISKIFLIHLDISAERMTEVMNNINSEFFGLVESGDTPSEAYKKMVNKNSYRILAETWTEPPLSSDVSYLLYFEPVSFLKILFFPIF